MKKLLALVLALVLVFSFAACGSKTEKSETSSDLGYITDKGTLVVGITDYKPMDFKDKDGSWTGFDAEFAEAVAEKLGLKVEFIEIDWDNKALELDAKSIDCVWNGMTLTDEVEKSMECTNPYVENAQVVVMSADKADSYKDVDSLKGLKFAAETGSAGEGAIKDNGLDANYTAVAAQTDALMEVASGSADACVIDITMANAMTGEGTSYANLKSGVSLTSEKYVIGFRKGSDAAVKVNEIMAEMMKDGTLDKLAEKYSLTLVK